MSKKNGNKQQKLTARQKSDRVKAAEERERRAREAEERKMRLKRIGVIAVCLVLVVALGLPTMALAVLGA